MVTAWCTVYVMGSTFFIRASLIVTMAFVFPVFSVLFFGVPEADIRAWRSVLSTVATHIVLYHGQLMVAIEFLLD